MKLTLIVFCAFAVYQASASELSISRSKCKKGAEFVCQSTDIARACGAIEYCNHNVWDEQRVLDADKPAAAFGCEVCMDAMKSVYDQVQNPKTQTILKTYAADACKMIEFESVQKACLKFVDQQLIKILTSNLNPDNVCTEIWACKKTANGFDLKDLFNHLSAFDYENGMKSMSFDRNVGNMDCIICKKAANKASEFMEEESEAKFKELLQHVCEAPNVKNKTDCLRWVDENSDWIYENLGPIISAPSVCKTFGVCPNESDEFNLAPMLSNVFQAINSKLSTKRMTSANQQSFACSICKETIDEVRKYLKSLNSTSFRKELELVCAYTGAYKSECKNLIDEFADMIYDELVDTFKDYKLCEQFGQCSVSKVSKFDTDSNQSFHSEESKDPSAECIICQQLIKSLEDEVDSNSSKEEIKESLERICSLIPSKKTKSECKQYVEKNAEHWIDLIVKSEHPKIVCKEIGVCGSSNDIVIQSKHSSLRKKHWKHLRNIRKHKMFVG